MPDLEELLDELPDLICCFGCDGSLSYVNQAYAAFYGATPGELIGTSFLDLVPAEFRSVVEANLRNLRELRPENPTVVDVHQGGDAAGNARWFRWTNKAFFEPGSDEPVEFAGIGHDVTAQREAEERTRYLAAHDSLTGLINRHTLREELEAQLKRARRENRRFGLLYLDLDGLKTINDRYGHSAGDDFIKRAAITLLQSFRDSDIVGRIGGDEFVIICPGVADPAPLAVMLQRARAELRRTHLSMSAAAEVGISAGMIVCDGSANADTVLQQADQAMYDDKDDRKSRSRPERH
jgi:diguanylate cyclase (GGDEF)-like protein/PAS domain S-box-containing protein